MAVFFGIVRLAGVPLSPSLLLGGMVAGALGPGVWLGGFLIVLTLSALFGLGYGWVFGHLFRSANWKLGAVVALPHALLVGFALAAVPPLHPLIPEALPTPGPFFSGFGAPGVAAFFLSHLFFGMTVGGLCKPSLLRAAGFRQTP